MAGSNDLVTRTQIFDWIARHEKTFYNARLPIHPIGVYFSPASRNFDPDCFLPSYRGTLVLLLQNHTEFEVVTPRTLADFRGTTLVLPDVSSLDGTEHDQLRAFLARGGRLIVEGADEAKLPSTPNVIRFPDSPGRVHLAALEKDFAGASHNLPAEFLSALAPANDLVIRASPFVASNTASVDGQTHVFFANFGGLVPHHNLKPTPEADASITVTNSRKYVMHFLPFLGEEQIVAGTHVGDTQVFSLPGFDRAAVAWFEDAK
jgi:hypothetical protein